MSNYEIHLKATLTESLEHTMRCSDYQRVTSNSFLSLSKI